MPHSPSTPDAGSDTGSSRTPKLSELELETALFRCIPQARPVGRHKHFQMISLQTVILRRTGLLIPTEDLWTRLGGLYDLEALDDLSSTSSSSSTPPSPVRTRPRKRPFQLPVSAPCDDDENDEGEAEAWRRLVYAGRPDASPGSRAQDEAEWEGGVKRQSRETREDSSSLSEEEDRGPKRKRESTGSNAPSIRSKKAKTAKVAPGKKK